MKGISLTQPWSSLVAMGEKKMETRSWKPSQETLYNLNSTQPPQAVAIHASKSFPMDCKDISDEFWTSFFKDRSDAENFKPFILNWQLPLGAIIGTVQILGALPTEKVIGTLSRQEEAFGDYSPGRFAWNLFDARMLKTPIPCKGALNLWNVPKEIEEQLTTAEYY